MQGFFERVVEHAAARPAAPALSRRAGGGYETESWSALASRARRLAAHLADVVPAGGVVPILAGKSADTVAAMLGIEAVGGAFAALNPRLRLPQLLDALVSTESPLAVVDGAGLRVLAGGAAEPRIAAKRWLLVDSGSGPLAQTDLARLRAAGVRITLAETLEEPAAGWRPASWVGGARRPGCCLFTSGSTGTPKGVLVSRDDLLARAAAEEAWFRLDPGDVLLSILPFSFDVGLTQLLSALRVGCELVVAGSWLPRDLVEASRARGVTGICGVPAIWQDLLAAGLRFDAPPPRYVTVSGGSLAPEQLQALSRHLGGTEIFKTYGQTEAFRTTSLRPEELPRAPGSVGRAYPGVRLAVVREDGTPCEPLEPGEVVHAGLGTMLGYLGGGAGGKLRPFPGSGEPAVFTGDVGYLDEDGFLFLAGRRDAMAKIAGNRVFPAEVANQAAALAEVAEAQVVAALRGAETVLVCFVVLRAGQESDPVRLRRSLADRLPSYMVPAEVVLLDEMPRTASGKPDLVELAARAAGAEPATLAELQR